MARRMQSRSRALRRGAGGHREGRSRRGGSDRGGALGVDETAGVREGGREASRRARMRGGVHGEVRMGHGQVQPRAAGCNGRVSTPERASGLGHHRPTDRAGMGPGQARGRFVVLYRLFLRPRLSTSPTSRSSRCHTSSQKTADHMSGGWHRGSNPASDHATTGHRQHRLSSVRSEYSSIAFISVPAYVGWVSILVPHQRILAVVPSSAAVSHPRREVPPSAGINWTNCQPATQQDSQGSTRATPPGSAARASRPQGAVAASDTKRRPQLSTLADRIHVPPPRRM
nr:hypothetical protein CFP56_07812 [Quercus suber]